MSLGEAGLGGAGVSFGEKLAGGGFQGGNSRDQLGPVCSVERQPPDGRELDLGNRAKNALDAVRS